MIEVKNLTKRYGKTVAVDGISFKINNGRIYGLLGPNGAGKSTTLGMLAGCLAPSCGRVRINGFDVQSEPKKAKKYIGYLPEIPPLYDEMTPVEYLSFVAEAKGVSYERGVRQVNEVLELTGLDGVKRKLIRQLSKGTRQRVGIAQALLGNPEIIILDEPTVGLDPRQITEIRALVRRLGEKRTVIISSHLLSEVEELCDHVLILSEGKLIANAPIEELREMRGGQRLSLTVRGEAADVIALLSGIDGIVECKIENMPEEGVVDLMLTVSGERDVRDDIFFAMAEHRCAVLSMEREERSLESVFLSLTEKGKEDAPNASDLP